MHEEDWASRRRANATRQAELARKRQAAEAAQAAQYLTLFVAAARRAGLAPTNLRVQGYNGSQAKSSVTGWYLRLDRTVGVGTDGQFYVLTAPLSFLDRFRTIKLTAEPAPLVIGQGGRDGDSIALTAALDRLLPGWEETGRSVNAT
ncbi:hypothetical protein [Buchananella hordeovulneris]|uniref:Uncharacterized protein n=1 Tax=Buchananella hordeovulneris TaxID=52770 RepID=A0A1Q5PWD0_9ACTO|nr:hypothetical protein [Buchananella hordeovulneris]OKL51772.1 hypothetical protein BSZ40_06380 [Buchananella hordeovulneris]RRD45107.1 hypothetical protein EII13_02900 [Buchananella hordeovulneris]RRD53081.1 hypothetical protein EII12_03035 [Buchananella hordeovulneris]